MGRLPDERRERFCRAYMRKPVAAQACREAGYGGPKATPQYHAMHGGRLMRQDEIKRRLDELAATHIKRDLKPEHILARLWELVETSKADATKAKALELLGKAHGLYTDVIEERPSQQSESQLIAALAASDDPLAKAYAERRAQELGLAPPDGAEPDRPDEQRLN